MIKEIFEKILNNSSELLEEELQYINPYLQKGIVKIVDDAFVLSKKYKVGILNVQNDFIKFQALGKDTKTIKINDLGSCNNGDLVLVQVIFNPKGGLKAKILEVLQNNQNNTLAIIKENKLFYVQSMSKINMNINLQNYVQGDILVLNDSKITSHLGNISNASIDEKISLHLFEENYRTDKDYTCDIPKINDIKNRVDLRDLPFATIDPASAKDHDDAIYFDKQNNDLYVAIADVSAYIKEGSPLDKEARKRAFSIYLPNKVLPMIPHILSDDLCSLRVNEDRLAYVCKMNIDTKTLEVKSSTLIEALINTKYKYAYEDIDEQIQNNTLSDDINQLYKLTIKLRKKRLTNGYDFRTSEYRLKLNKNLNLKEVLIEHGSASHQLVEECMLLANICTAKKLENNGIFRIHEEPKRSKIDDLITNVSLLGIDVKLKSDIHSTIESIQQKASNVGLENEVDKLIIQSQQQASYSSKLSSHFGLGFKHYSHFTSPIRRYSDLVLHRILKSLKIPKDIDNICENISSKERVIAKLVWDLEDRIYARYAFNNINKVYEGIITDVKERPQGEFINNISGLSVDIENFDDELLFSKINFEILHADLISKKITAKIVR